MAGKETAAAAEDSLPDADVQGAAAQRQAQGDPAGSASGESAGDAREASSGSGRTCCCGGSQAAPRYKHTPRPDDFQKDVQKRLNRVIGQLNGVKNMIDDNRYCGDVLTQLAAAESAVKRISDMVLREHLETCVVERVQGGDTEVIEEVMDLIRKFK